MARRATKDTYGTDDVGGGTEVRRRVFAGDIVPDHWDVEEGSTEDIPEQTNVIGERVPAAQRTSTEEATLQQGATSRDPEAPPAEQPTEPGSRRRRAG